MSKLGNYISVQNGYGFKSKDFIKNLSGMPVIKIGNVTGGSFIDLSSYDTISEEIARKVKSFQTKDNDILIAMTGANVGKVSRIAKGTQPCLINQRVGRFILKEDCPYSSDFIYYLVSSNKSFQYFSNTADGAAQPNISGKLIEDLGFPDISPKAANKAGKYLKVLDEKIQLNTQINQTLEQIAQALFKSWFVDFDPVRAKVQALSDGLNLEQAELAAMQAISGKTPEELTALSQTQPERYAELAETAKAFPCEMVDVDGVEVPKGWEVKPLPEIIDFLEGPGIRNWQYTEEEDGIKFINIRCIQNGDLTLTTANKITKEEVFGKYKHFQLEEDDIVVSTSGTLGRFAFVRKEHLPLSLNTSVIRFRPIKNKSTLGFIAGFVENQLQHELEIRASGSAQRNFGPTHLKQISLLVPDFKLLELHQKYASSLFEKRKQLLSEIDTLKDTRDLLLPRLLKGEI
ncbi:restriction endonuclease subunit S [Haemophilus influenzae]|uniref:Type I restriction modification DNA specificity domain protein n=1 Tax=Haemophilus influenzae TaxID=727 RepID=A0AAX3IQ51_HAEIF|nr:restriction endonuclease subunit S [Haemophilus influenzae]RFN95405.1 restriction endonuclease subunit S [Haemophilus influenzae]VTX49892.1 Type I restriction modification DNA specificity domain protein [Haemophilus influenzae]